MTQMQTILIVDDDDFFREILKEALQDRYQLIAVDNGEEAICLARTHTPNLIILDVEMPGRNGIEICKELKADPETQKIPVILFTSNSNRDDILLGLKAGADDYFTKPLFLSEIALRVDAHLRTRDFYADLQREDLLLLLGLWESVSAIRNPMTILRIIVEKMSDIIDVARCSIVSANQNNELIVKASNDLALNKEIKLDPCRYPEILAALESKQSVIINNVKTDPLMASVREHIKGIEYNSIIVSPVVKKESVIGTFCLRTATPVGNAITDRINKLCQLIANISANALEKAILLESMQKAQDFYEEMSNRDGLTDLYNHRYFYNRLKEEFSRASRYNEPLSLIFIDIDDFKRINDNYSHTHGDAVLKEIGLLLKNLCRESDFTARYGGEEFAIVLPNTPPQDALGVATRLCSLIQKHAFTALKKEQITVSSGTSTFIDNNLQSYKQLVQQADEAMYKAKSNGKNCATQVWVKA